METASQYFVYVYRDAKGNPVYIGQGKNVGRALSHEAGASNPAFRTWLEQNERTAQVEVIGPLGSKKMVDAVETALISACKPATALKLFNVAPGVSTYAFRPLGVPVELADRTTRPLGTEDLAHVARTHGPLMFVYVNEKAFPDDPDPLRHSGFDRAKLPSDAEILARMRGNWQVANRLAAWTADPETSPGLLIAVNGGPGTQSIIASAAIDRRGWDRAERIAKGLVILQLLGGGIDTAELRGRPIRKEVGLRFGSFPQQQFRLFGPDGLIPAKTRAKRC